MKKKPASKILGAARFYTYFFSFSMAICLFVLPVATPRPKFMNSEFVDVLARCILWLNFVFAYWSVFTALKGQINGIGRNFLEMEKDISSCMQIAMSAIGLGFGIWLLTHWALLIFVPWLAKEPASFFAILNGFIYAIFVFSRYFWLIESE
jgi:hypothetical protein